VLGNVLIPIETPLTNLIKRSLGHNFLLIHSRDVHEGIEHLIQTMHCHIFLAGELSINRKALRVIFLSEIQWR
jgi:hypothetical protein